MYGVTGAIDNAVRQDTGTLRTDLLIEISNRIVSDLLIGVDTGTLKSDVTNYVNLTAVQTIMGQKTFISSGVFTDSELYICGCLDQTTTAVSGY